MLGGKTLVLLGGGGGRGRGSRRKARGSGERETGGDEFDSDSELDEEGMAGVVGDLCQENTSSLGLPAGHIDGQSHSQASLADAAEPLTHRIEALR